MPEPDPPAKLSEPGQPGSNDELASRSKLKDYPVRLEIFEGPLDLLLYLIKREEMDITHIPLARITEQYLEYLALMEMLDLEIAGEFLVVAATLLQIKSRKLLPPEEQPPLEEDELDPEQELIQRLIEYKRFKEAAAQLSQLEIQRQQWIPRIGPDPVTVQAEPAPPGFETSLFDLISAFAKVLREIPKETFFEVVVGEVTVEEKIHELLHALADAPAVKFSALFAKARHKIELIAMFLAILELMRVKEIIVRQSELFGEIEIARNQARIQPVTSGT